MEDQEESRAAICVGEDMNGVKHSPEVVMLKGFPCTVEAPGCVLRWVLTWSVKTVGDDGTRDHEDWLALLL